ncbi:MAG: DUF2793 domain-containing protein [Hyphomicrobiaceae bacterium]|nr:DUF2793 domain-containing protein [Hyphomicrobiaceae bacterium]
MDNSPNLVLPYIQAAQAQKHITHNEAIRALDAIVQISVADRDLAVPPGSPTEGIRYLIAGSPTGAWSGHAGKIAAWQDGAWMFYVPKAGWLAYIADEGILVAYSGSAWNPVSSSSSVALLGINATADTTNRLSISSQASLFNHAGNGHQAKLNKNAAGDTASFLFQTGFSGRAEMGTTGDDDFHFKVSPDGSAWTEALTINRTTGLAKGRQGGAIPSVSASILTADLAKANVATAQAWFGSGDDEFAISASTTYAFEGLLSLSRAAGATSHTTAILFGGTATLTSIGYLAQVSNPTGNVLTATQQIFGSAASALVLTGANTVATENVHVLVKGIVRCNAAGTFIPQFIYSAAPGGAPTVRANSHFMLYPVGGNAVAQVGAVS